jgi:ABC-type xylose transport system permease subunit
LIGVCVVAVGGIIGIYWAWYRALHDERGPALVATAATVVAFIGLMAMLHTVEKPPPPPPSQTENW